MANIDQQDADQESEQISSPNTLFGSSPEIRKLMEDPATVKANMDKVKDILGKVGMKFPQEWTQNCISEYVKIFEQIEQKNMNKQEAMNFLQDKIGQFKIEADTFNIREVTSGAAMNQLSKGNQSGEVKSGFLTKEQKYMVIMGVAILAAIIALAFINPVWAGTAALALISILGGVVVINGGKGKTVQPVKAVNDAIPGSRLDVSA